MCVGKMLNGNFCVFCYNSCSMCRIATLMYMYGPGLGLGKGLVEITAEKCGSERVNSSRTDILLSYPLGYSGMYSCTRMTRNVNIKLHESRTVDTPVR